MTHSQGKNGLKKIKMKTKMKSVFLFLLMQCISCFKVPSVGKYNNVFTAPYHPALHNFGNVGVGGWIHAKLAWSATRAIDAFAYDGVNMRQRVAEAITLSCEHGTLLEVGCGVGTLTSELVKTGAFDVIALDTSEEMLSVAKNIINASECTFHCNNVMFFGKKVDVSVVCMVMHEMPERGHKEILTKLFEITTHMIWLIDIDPTYIPSEMMLSGEPYVLDYLQSFEITLTKECECKKFNIDTFPIIPNHVRAWVLTSP